MKGIKGGNVDNDPPVYVNKKEEKTDTHRMWIKTVGLSTARKRHKQEKEKCKKTVLGLITQKLFTYYAQNVDKSCIGCDFCP